MTRFLADKSALARLHLSPVRDAARATGLTVLHYDNDFDTIASFTEQSTQWVVRAGTV